MSTKEEMLEVFESVKNRAKDIALSEGHLTPVLFMSGREKKMHIIALVEVMRSQETKNAFGAQLPAMAERFGADFMVFVCEANIYSMARDGTNETRLDPMVPEEYAKIKERAEKIDVFMVQLNSPTFNTNESYEIIRNAKGEITDFLHREDLSGSADFLSGNFVIWEKKPPMETS